ncbi:hypothetical protein Tco_1089844 [Tanacetum coccineum]
MSESAMRHEENSNLIEEIRATTDAAIRNQGASIKTLEIQIGQVQKRGFGSLPSSTETTREIKSSRFQPLLKLIHTRYAILDHPNTPYPLDRIVNCCTSQDKQQFLFQFVWIIITVKKKRGPMDQNS